MRTGARATKQKYISIYISLSMKTFLKTGVYIYIYIFNVDGKTLPTANDHQILQGTP